MAIVNRYDEVVDGATNFHKEGDSRVRSVKSYRQVKSQPGGSLPRHVPTSQMPTFKSYRQAKSPPEAVYRDTHRQCYKEVQPTSQKPTWKQSAETHTDKPTKKFYREVKSTPRGMSTKSTKIVLKPPVESATLKSTRWSPKRTSKDDYRVNATYR